MFKNKIFYFHFLFLSLAFVFQTGCNKVQFTDASTANSLSIPDNPPEVKSLCDSLVHRKLNQNFFFPKPSITCEWEKDGNLGIRDGFFQARIEETQNLNLPERSVICDVKFSFAQQKFLYDDHFLMTFDGAVVASSYNFSSRLVNINGLLRYDWGRMAGMVWDHSQETVFCPTGAQCSWPVTDTPGDILMSYPDSLFQKIMAEDLNRHSHPIQFVSIGDNDAGDCEHSDVSFGLEVEYVVP